MKQPKLDWVTDMLVSDIVNRQHLHGGTPRGKLPRVTDMKKKGMKITNAPDATYGIGPSGGLMRGYGKEPVSVKKWVRSLLGRRGA